MLRDQWRGWGWLQRKGRGNINGWKTIQLGKMDQKSRRQRRWKYKKETKKISKLTKEDRVIRKEFVINKKKLKKIRRFKKKSL